MVHEMRRRAQQLADPQALALLRGGSWGVLSTADEDGIPYGTPLNYVLWDGRICFHCAPEGHKARNLERNPRVCFTVVVRDEVLPEELTTKYASVICFGTAERLEGGEKEAALWALGRKHAPGLEDRIRSSVAKYWDRTDMWAVRPERITGKRGTLLDPDTLPDG